MSLLRTVTIADVFGSPNDWITPVTRGMGLRLRGSTSGYVGLKAPASGAAVDFTLPGADGTAGQAIITNGSGVLSFGSVTTSPGGSSGQLQYNNAGAFGGTANMRWSAVSPELIYDGQLKVNNLGTAPNRTDILIGGTGSSQNFIGYYSAQVNCLIGIDFYQGNSNTQTQLLQVPPSGYSGYVANSFSINIPSGGHPGVYIRNNSIAIAHFAQNGATTLTAGGPTVVPLTVKLASGQSANAFEVNTSGGSGGDLFKVSATGALTAMGSISTITDLRFTTSGSAVFRDMSARVRIANYEGTEIAAIQTNGGGAGLAMLKPIGFTTSYTSLGTVAIDRDADGVLAIHNGTAGQYRDLKLRAIELVDGNLVIGTTTGTKIGTATTQKLGFWNATPVVQPASANQAALIDSTGGTADGTVSAVSGTGDDVNINNNFKEVLTLLNQLRSDLVAIGLIKGAA